MSSPEELHELSKDMRIAELEKQLEIVVAFANLMAELADKDD